MKLTKEQFFQIIKEEYNSLKESVSLNDIKKEMESFDWSYDYADDTRSYNSGRAHEREIKKMVKDYLDLNPNDRQKIVKMSDDIQSKHFKKKVFNSAAWIHESVIKETKFYAFFNNKKIEIDGNSLWDAKQKAIKQLNVPKSKVGLLAVVNASEHDKGSFQYENIREASGYSNNFVSWFTGTVLNNVKHPMYGNRKLTSDQVKQSSGDYKNKIFKAIDAAVKRGDITRDIIKKNESVNEATVTSIPNFNLESDVYIEMFNILKSNNAFKKIVAKVGEDYYTGGNPKNLFTVLHGGLKKLINSKFISDVQVAVNKKRGPTFALSNTEMNSPEIIHKFSGVLALGVLSDLKEDPNSFPKLIGDPALIKAGSEFSANRGRAKMGVMMGNMKKK
jgi:hypothetical protein